MWFDDITGRLNTLERGNLLGEFDTGNNIFVLYNDGSFEVTDTDVQQRFDVKEIQHLCKFDPEMVVNAVHYDGHKGWTMVKRFKIEGAKLKERYSFLTDHNKSKVLFASMEDNPRIKYTIKIKGKAMTGEVSIGEFMDVKGWKAVGNRLSDQMLSAVKEIEVKDSKLLPKAKPEAAAVKQSSLFGDDEEAAPAPKVEKKEEKKDAGEKKTYKTGDTIEFD